MTKVCGIYKIINLINNKAYIGQSKNIPLRISNHKFELNKNKHPNKHLQNSWNKFGKENFYFGIICECSPEKLDSKEIEYIKIFNSISNGYNTKPGGVNSEEAKQYGRKIARETYEKKINNKGTCRVCGAETKNGYIRYCENHNRICKKYGKRFGKNKKGYICEKCKITYGINTSNPIISYCIKCRKKIEKKSNIQKYCKECAKIVSREKHRKIMREKRTG